MRERAACHECGARVEPGHQFCRGCGCDLLPADLPVEQMVHLKLDPSGGKHKRSMTPAVISCILILLVLAIMIPDFNRTGGRNHRRSCQANMRVLEGAVDMWEMDQERVQFGHGADCEIRPGEGWGTVLVPNYVKKIPPCRQKGVYRYHARSHSVWCTRHNTVEYPTMDGSGVAPGP